MKKKKKRIKPKHKTVKSKKKMKQRNSVTIHVNCWTYLHINLKKIDHITINFVRQHIPRLLSRYKEIRKENIQNKYLFNTDSILTTPMSWLHLWDGYDSTQDPRRCENGGCRSFHHNNCQFIISVFTNSVFYCTERRNILS